MSAITRDAPRGGEIHGLLPSQGRRLGRDRSFDLLATSLYDDRMWTGPPFGGAKIALFCEESLLVYLRDDRSDIPFPAHWDLPGGGREGEESPADCALRETLEEFGLRLTPDRILWQRRYASHRPGGADGYLMAGAITREEIAAIRFGDEGQYWELMPVDAFLAHDRAIPYLQARLGDYLREIEGRGPLS